MIEEATLCSKGIEILMEPQHQLSSNVFVSDPCGPFLDFLPFIYPCRLY